MNGVSTHGFFALFQQQRVGDFKGSFLHSFGLGLLGFTLSYGEFARSSLVMGEFNTLPLEIYAMTTNVTSPALYALVR